MKRFIRRIIKLNQRGDRIYEEEQEVIDHEDGNRTEIKTENYRGNPIEKTVFEQYVIMEREKNHLPYI